MRYPDILCAAALAVFAFFALLWLAGFPATYQQILSVLAVDPFPTPFLDAHGILSAVVCHYQGLDVFQTNPCDVLDRAFVYSPLWLLLPRSLGLEDTNALGIATDLLLILSLRFILKPASAREFWVLLTAVLSPPLIFAAERANADVYMLVLAASAAALCGRGPALRVLGYGAALFAASLKLYPFVLLGLCLRERWRMALAVSLISLAAAAAFVAAYADDLHHLFAQIQQCSNFRNCFSAKLLPAGIAELHPSVATRFGASFVGVTTAVLFVAMLALSGTLARALRQGAAVLDWEGRDMRMLLAGALLLAGCFLAASNNTAYREIHFLLVLPGLLYIAGATPDPLMRRITALTVGAILLVMWNEFLRDAVGRVMPGAGRSPGEWSTPQLGLWMARELLWWWIVSVLGAFIILFAVRSPVLHRLGIGGSGLAGQRR